MRYAMLPSQLADQVPADRSRRVGGVPKGGYYLKLECEIGAYLSDQYARIKALPEVDSAEYDHVGALDCYTIRLKVAEELRHAQRVRAKIEAILGSMDGRSLTIERSA